MPDAEFKPIPMSATDKLREYYQNSLGNLGLDQLCCISRTLDESKNARNEKEIIRSILSVLRTRPIPPSCLEKSPQISVESRKIIRAITTVMKLEKEYTDGGMGDNMENVGVKTIRDGDDYVFELYTVYECQPSAWPSTSNQDRHPSRSQLIPASQVAGVSTLTVQINKY